MEPTTFDPDANEVHFNYNEMQSSTLDEMQKFVDKCLNLTDSGSESSNSDLDSNGRGGKRTQMNKLVFSYYYNIYIYNNFVNISQKQY